MKGKCVKEGKSYRSIWRRLFLISVMNFWLLFGITVSAGENALELNSSNLNDIQNYQNGWYKSWGGAYAEANGSLCSVEWYLADKEYYYIHMNDSRIQLTISEYDVSGKWLKHSDKYQNGSKFVKQADTRYIHITVSSSVWGVNLKTLFENGLQITFDSTQQEYSPSITTIQWKDAVFCQENNWISGSFSKQTGEFIIDDSQIAFYAYCLPDDYTYCVNLPGGYLKMNILELNQEGKVIGSSDLYSGQKWKKKSDTFKIALTVYTNDKRNNSFTTEEYKKLIREYSCFGLQAYVSGEIKGSMDNVSATDFMELMNVGWNLGNSLDSKCDKNSRGKDANLKQELNWGNPYVTKDLIDFITACGFNTIRIPVTWYYNTETDSNGKLIVGQEWLARVKEVVDYAISNDLYVILNSHHDSAIFYAGVSEEKMQQVLKDTESLWSDVATYFMNYDEHLIFEAFNEVDNLERSWNYGDTAAQQMNRMNQVFVNTVRKTGGNNANRILMVPTLLDGIGEDILQAFVLPEDSAADRIIVQVHFYTKKFNQDLENEFKRLQIFSQRIGAPVIIGEFGTDNSYPLPELRGECASNYVARAAAHGIKCIWWDNGSNYGIIDRRDFTKSDMSMIKALFEGADGTAYNSTDLITINQVSNFTLRMPNLSSGIVEDAYWGTITTEMISLNKGKKCVLTLNRSGEADDIWFQRILFYSASGEYISGKELQTTNTILDIPEGASYFRISMNSPYRSISWNQYSNYLSEGKLSATICYGTPKGLVAVKMNKE